MNFLESFCNGNEGKNLSQYEKKRLQNLKRNYEVFQSAGSELKKCLDMVKSSVPGKVETKRKQKILNFKGKNFIAFALKDSEAYLKIIDNYGSQRTLMDNTEQLNDIDCDVCDRKYKGACPNHGKRLWKSDKTTSKIDPEKAAGTLSSFPSINGSSIPKACLGVFTEVPLPQGFVFGPYKGRVARNTREAQKSGYEWPVLKGQQAHTYVELEDESDSNWLRYVRCATHEKQQNLVAFQYKERVFYMTCKAVQPFTELLVWYGNEYADEVGIGSTGDNPKNLPSPKDIEAFECDICFAMFSTPSAVEGHRRTHTYMQPDKRHRCYQCSYSTDYMNNLQNHLLTHSGERPHRCRHCNKAFTQRSHLQTHLRHHMGELPYLCNLCGRAFHQRGGLHTHERIHSEEELYRCPTCGKGFIFSGNLKAHERVHMQQRPHTCPHCNKTFTKRGHLKIHLRHHTGERPYLCNLCGKAFQQIGGLHAHERIHSGEKPYRCPTCGKDFARRGDLKAHERVHTQQRPYRCPHCDYRSSQSSALRFHIVFKHTRDFKHTCSLCGKGFHAPCMLRKHIDRKHSEGNDK